MDMSYRKLRAPAIALALTLALAAPTLAASGTSAETLAVTSTISVTGVPATIDYGESLPGERVTAAPFGLTVSSNNSTGWSFTISASDLVSGGASIPSSARWFQIADADTTNIAPGLTYLDPWVQPEGGAYPGPADSPVEVVTSSMAQVEEFTITPAVNVPALAQGGAYTGSVTFAATNNP